MTAVVRKVQTVLVLLAFVAPVLAVGSASALQNNNYNNNRNYQNQNHEHEMSDPCAMDEEVEVPNVYDGFSFNSRNSRRHGRHHHNNHNNVTCVTATPATSVDPTCDQLGFYIIPTTEGVDYTVDGVVVAAGNHTVPNGTTVTIVAVAQQGYAFDQGTTTSWTYTINAPTGCATATTASATTPTPQVKVVPTGGVYAGGGGSQNNSAALFGLIGSTTALAVGLVRKFVA